ncbi:MAG: META domain-containing protein [Bacteroides sp.]|nr:META domain-containing protein [Roseburia sp.]MCM1347687.1 META domain-containing protein [Bacteroides sp.]MCM1420507.1 META domain-containing protein [Bacteroides sp.]
MAISVVAFSLGLYGCSSFRTTATDTADIIGEWSIVKAEQVSTKSGAAPATIRFDAEGKISGCASVNRFFGSYKFDGNALSLDGIGLTRMMGPNMEIEDAVVKALSETHSVQIKKNKASFFNSDGAKVMELKKMAE